MDQYIKIDNNGLRHVLADKVYLPNQDKTIEVGTEEYIDYTDDNGFDLEQVPLVITTETSGGYTIKDGVYYNISDPCTLILPCVTKFPDVHGGKIKNSYLSESPIKFYIRKGMADTDESKIVLMDEAGRVCTTNVYSNSFAAGLVPCDFLGVDQCWKTITVSSILVQEPNTECVHLEVK